MVEQDERRPGRCRRQPVLQPGEAFGRKRAVAGSPAFQMGLDLTATPHEPPLVREPYAYYVYRIEGGDIAVHTRYVPIDA